MLNLEHYPDTSLDLSSCVCHYLRQCLVESFMLPGTIDREHGEEAPLTIARNQMRSRSIGSKADNRQVDRGRRGILSWLSRFDYEHERRFTEHEHDICDCMPESIATYPECSGAKPWDKTNVGLSRFVRDCWSSCGRGCIDGFQD
jgi:hypothetical protein